MKSTLLIFYAMLLAGMASEGRAAQPSLCGRYNDVYKTQILQKIQSGIPFELMGVLFDKSGDIHQRYPVRISFDLWDEVVTVESGEKILAKIPLKQTQEKLCSYLEMPSTAFARGEHYTYRLLLNPMWAGRVARLRAQVAPGAESTAMLRVNWDKLAREMPSEKVLLEWEVSP